MTGAGAMDVRDKALEIHHRLCQAYHCPISYFHTLDPLSELVSSLLSHRTRNADSGAAFKALRARFPDWAEVAAAPTVEVEAAIARATWPEQKAPRRVLEAQLPPDWDAQQIYDNHEVLMLHGQRCCFFRKPACARCPLLDLCPAGQAMHGGLAQAS